MSGATYLVMLLGSSRGGGTFGPASARPMAQRRESKSPPPAIENPKIPRLVILDIPLPPDPLSCGPGPSLPPAP